ncbi:hypothetical protein A1F99_027910 [Pyrenophora tritici-repentis]|nr:hypothetical protein A1F99_027910 [Pyrenophora tritici-repentis]
MQLLIAFVLGSFTIAVIWKSIFSKFTQLRLRQKTVSNKRHGKIEAIKALTEHHEVAELLSDLIQKDGAGSWPPNTNHVHATWPSPLRAYKEIYLELAPLLPQEEPPLDDKVNVKLISEFRERFRELLRERVNLVEVKKLLEAADAGRWVDFPRDVYNAFYCCVASSRHAYRWATIPVVKVAQLEKEIKLPIELVEPWQSLQRHFGCPSDAGNVSR